MLCLVGVGLRILGLLGGRACEYFCFRLHGFDNVMGWLADIYSVNWYQRNYPYAWCGARIVRDI